MEKSGDEAVFNLFDAEEIEIPDELFLRETLETKADDADAVLDYCVAWGPLVLLGDDPVAFLPTAKFPVTKAYQPWVDQVHKRRARPGEVRLPFELVRVHLVVAQTLTSHWLHHATGGSHVELPGIWGASPVRPTTADAAWKVFFTHIDHALQHLSVHLSSPEIEWQPPHVNTYMANCLQIYNHAASSATYQRCRNETCGRFFHTQRGRSEVGQYRTRGVLYCSPSCARAQAQREYRRRKSKQENDKKQES